MGFGQIGATMFSVRGQHARPHNKAAVNFVKREPLRSLDAVARLLPDNRSSGDMLHGVTKRLIAGL